jgi:hypothetical protein
MATKRAKGLSEQLTKINSNPKPEKIPDTKPKSSLPQKNRRG